MTTDNTKKLQDLVVEEGFHVHSVISESYATSHTPMSERVSGGRSPVYETGFTSILTLEVTPADQFKNIPVRTLKFSGYSIVKAGDHIYAKIPKFNVINSFSAMPGSGKKYTDREFNEEEFAIEIAINSVGRKDRSADYDTYFPKNS